MSHTVTVTRTTTSTTTSAIILNTGYCKTTPGLLKIAEVILGLALFILMLFYSEYYNVYDYREHAITGQMWLLLVVFACLVCSTCLLIACLFSLSTSSIIAKTFFELVYHFVAFVMYLIVVILFFINKNKPNDRHPYSTTLVLGVVLTVLYLLSTVFAYRGYRTI